MLTYYTVPVALAAAEDKWGRWHCQPHSSHKELLLWSECCSTALKDRKCRVNEYISLYILLKSKQSCSLQLSIMKNACLLFLNGNKFC